jgi:hypothetical protein
MSAIRTRVLLLGNIFYNLNVWYPDPPETQDLPHDPHAARSVSKIRYLEKGQLLPEGELALLPALKERIGIAQKCRDHDDEKNA